MDRRTKLIAVLLILCSFLAGRCSSPASEIAGHDYVDQPRPPTALPAYAPGQASYVHIETNSSWCSGVVVGKHTILTAEHCFTHKDFWGRKPELESVNDVPMHGTIIANDGHDHVLLKVDGDLSQYRIAKIASMPPPGTDLYFWGGPGELREVLRKGYVAGVWKDPESGKVFTLMEMNTWHGDSGGAFFDKDGNVVTVLRGGLADHITDKDGETVEYWDITIVEPLAFHAGQLGLIE